MRVKSKEGYNLYIADTDTSKEFNIDEEVYERIKDFVEVVKTESKTESKSTAKGK